MNGRVNGKVVSKPKPPERCPEYLAFLRGRGCVLCGNPGEAAHLGRRGMGQKPGDFSATTLCREHHMMEHAGNLSDDERRFAEWSVGQSLGAFIEDVLAAYHPDQEFVVRKIPVRVKLGERRLRGAKKE